MFRYFTNSTKHPADEPATIWNPYQLSRTAVEVWGDRVGGLKSYAVARALPTEPIKQLSQRFRRVSLDEPGQGGGRIDLPGERGADDPG